MRNVVWANSARDDFLQVLHYIAKDDPDAAQRVGTEIERTGRALGDYATGRPSRVTGTYEKSVTGLPYIITYVLTPDDRTFAIMHVIHAARDWRDESWPG